MRISDWSSDVCSSDLTMGTTLIFVGLEVCDGWCNLSGLIGLVQAGKLSQEIAPPYRPSPKPTQVEWRSEEHTSELQSLMRTSYAVFCLKKKRQTHKKTHTNYNIKTIIALVS